MKVKAAYSNYNLFWSFTTKPTTRTGTLPSKSVHMDDSSLIIRNHCTEASFSEDGGKSSGTSKSHANIWVWFLGRCFSCVIVCANSWVTRACFSESWTPRSATDHFLTRMSRGSVRPTLQVVLWPSSNRGSYWKSTGIDGP